MPSLFLQTELLDNRVIAALVIRFQIAQVIAAVGDHLEKTAAGMKILRVLLEVLRKLVNLLGKERDLHIRRTGVSVVPGGTFHDRRLFLSCKHEFPYPTTSCENAQVYRSSENVRGARNLAHSRLRFASLLGNYAKRHIVRTW